MQFSLLIILFSAFVASVAAASCSSYNSSCVQCIQQGCHYCIKATGPSFCTSSNSSAAVGCNQQSVDSMDLLTNNVNDCGSCTGEDCYTCSQQANCGYCWTGQATGCKIDTGSAPSGCTVWSGHNANCVIPCNGRTSCQNCVSGSGGTTCVWCSTNTQSAFAGSCNVTGLSSCFTTATQCPALPKANYATQVTVVGLLTVILLVVAVLL